MYRTSFSWALCSLFFVLIGIGASPAEAQKTRAGDTGNESEAGEVEELSAAGIQAYREERYGEALSLFKQALAIQPVTNLLFNIGRTYERLGETDQAIRYYRRFLNAPDIPEQALEKVVEKLRQLTAKKAEAEEDIRPRDVEDDEVDEAAVEAGEPVDLSLRQIWGWTAVSGGVLLLATGATFAVLAGQEQDLFNETDLLAEKQAHEGNATSLALGADITLGLGAVAAMTGVVLLILDASGSDEASTRFFTPAFLSDGVGFRAGIRF